MSQVVTAVDALFRQSGFIYFTSPDSAVDDVHSNLAELECDAPIKVQLPRRPDDLRLVAIELLHVLQTVRLVAHDHCFLGAAHDCSC